jgi:preprotein translocase subunit SecB
MAQAQQAVLNVQRVYLKDLSIEVPNAPAIFLEQKQANFNMEMDTNATVLSEGIYEVTVFATVTTKVGDKIAFLAEAKQSGIFEIRGIPEEQMPIVLEVTCPNIIFPYLSANIGDAVSRTGFPPLNLPIGFFDMRFQRKLEEAQNAAAGTPNIVLPN